MLLPVDTTISLCCLEQDGNKVEIVSNTVTVLAGLYEQCTLANILDPLGLKINDVTHQR